MDHAAILDIMQQSSITFTSSTIRMNVHLVRVSWFLRQFRLVVRYKLEKEQIMLDALSKLASANNLGYTPFYSELNAVFVYYTTLVKIHPDLISHILEDYAANNW